jgi:beta-lactamase regulating signal transducer with metallopeptidase domain
MLMGVFLTLLLAMGAGSFVAIALVLVARGALRRRFGPALAYCAWVVVPVVVLAMAFSTGGGAQRPAPVVTGQALTRTVPAPNDGALAQWVPAATGSALAQLVPAAPDTAQLILWIWGVGAVLTALALFWVQVRYVRELGALWLRDGVWYTARTEVSPCVIGLIRPRIVVPADFDSRYTPREREMILSHERMHVRRGDLVANGISTLIRCLLWFNPLTHLGTDCFRFDQELACDASTLHRCSGSRRCYAEALLKTVGVDRPLPLSSLWQSAHPLKERLLTLQQSPASGWGRMVGSGLIVGATVLLAVGAWQVHPAQAYSARAAVIHSGAVCPLSAARNRRR